MQGLVTQLARGQVIRQPAGFEKGYWAGAPGAYYDRTERACYVAYRVRRPRGVQPDRGGESRIARSTDLETFQDIWSVEKSSYGTASIERSTLRKGLDNQWRYYTSYVDPVDGRWCVAMIKSAQVESFDPARVQRVFSASPLGLEGIKDPWILEWNGSYFMFLSVALRTDRTTRDSHMTSDIYNTGECLSATGLAISTDLDQWEWQGTIFVADTAGWDGYCRRINSVLPYRGKFIAFYDGSASEKENYEEKTGLAISDDLTTWKSVSAEAPLLTSPHATHSLRYIDAVPLEEKVCLFYEFARPDGAHDLRLMQKDMALFLNELEC